MVYYLTSPLRAAAMLVLLAAFAAAPAYAVDEIVPEQAHTEAAALPNVSVAEGKEYMVVAAHELAVQAGTEIIEQGGNAIDAAIAVQMVLNVVEPQSSGIGGGGFMLYYDAGSRTLHGYDGRETAPVAIDPKLFMDEKGVARPFAAVVRGGASVGVPGLLRMLELAHTNHGEMEWSTLFSPAITVAEEGFPLSPRLHNALSNARELADSQEARALFFLDRHRVKPLGTVINNPRLARVFTYIAEEGAQHFYTGELATRIVQTVLGSERNPGYMVLEDLAAYQAKERPVLCSKYHHSRVCGVSPPSSGPLAVLQALGMLEQHDMSLYAANHPQALHIMNEALKRAFAERNRVVADPDFADMKLKAMLSREYLHQQGALIHVDEQAPSYALPETEPPSTTHISIIDKAGNAVSMTTSIEHAFGSGLMVEGFLLNNQLTDFSFVPEDKHGLAANRVEPRKRPRSSMAPMMVFDQNEELSLLVGSPGGARIISFVLHALVAHLDWRLSPADIVALPRFATIGGNVLEVEQGSALDDATIRLQLEAHGHKVKPQHLTSGVHLIRREEGVLTGAADPRREGKAVGK